MSSSCRPSWLVPALLCALAVLAARPAETPGRSPARGGAELGVSAQVARLYEEAAVATRQYEEGRRAAETERTRARQLDELLDRERKQLAVLHKDLGRIARAQYRSGGDVPLTARMLLTDHPEELLRRQHAVSRADLAVTDAIRRSRSAEARLAADEVKAAARWRALEQRNVELVALKADIEAKLEEARRRLQVQADSSTASGTCRGAVRLDQPHKSVRRAWVAPVREYELSAPFGSGGARWANRHTGQDFAVPIGTPVRSVGGGRVVRVSCGGAFGIQIVVAHPGGYYTQYAHLASVAVDQGERLVPGQWIGQSGTTGNSTGPHLHFEVRVTPELGSGVDPVPWLAARGVRL
ncbi:M23 family metallopeptidase [Streptomyces chromofuscus]|uniref:Peptidoglycan DD-metalloendopeptidase family protein n=1 Tax=Streptomyces chromofuscus TaxID=42881 RepID=A0A7M2T2S9_STRCW|nr:M23 family metallopeptidase [Streptomyces chromofuscus]QOV41821.1 peptidoglycan DD-metalloendopeptidase family protein [Streptomyces chromofuscus]GGS88115.1 peptidase [Streptomyces chromofuscus]